MVPLRTIAQRAAPRLMALTTQQIRGMATEKQILNQINSTKNIKKITSSMKMVSAAKLRVLAGYRKLFRARQSLFEGDVYALKLSREQMRAEFMRNKNVSITSPEFEVLVAGIDEATDMLLHEVVRGELNESTGRYEVKIKKDHVRGSSTGESEPEAELITEETVKRMENPVEVEVCKSKSSK